MWAVEGKAVRSIEGLGTAESPHPLQRAFSEHHGLQCGYCTPGMLMSAKQLLERSPSPTEHDVRRAIQGNICRCTGYAGIVEAILAVSRGEVSA